jgi:hypothetical protein
MADDQNQRPYRSNETLTRAARTAASGSDPLAELARLIGQNAPFAGRDIARRAPAAQPSAPAASPYGAPNLERQPYAADDNLYQDEARRVELNAMTSPQFVAFVERKLRENGIAKRLLRSTRHPRRQGSPAVLPLLLIRFRRRHVRRRRAPLLPCSTPRRRLPATRRSRRTRPRPPRGLPSAPRRWPRRRRSRGLPSLPLLPAAVTVCRYPRCVARQSCVAATCAAGWSATVKPYSD